jgi:hypothetical protein
MNQAIGLDHVGIVGRDLGTLAAAFESLGFHLTPLARHAGGRTGNRCAMLPEGGYLELMSTIDGGTSATLDRFLARHAGAHILALGIDNENAVADRLRRAWGSVPDATPTDRAVDDADPDGPRARFSLIVPPDRPEGRVHLIRHETPEALWQPRFLRHENNALALEEVILVVPDPAVTAAWYSTLAGRPVVPDPAGGFALPLPHGRVRILHAGAFDGPEPPSIAAIALRTGDGHAAARLVLEKGNMAYAVTDDCMHVKIAGITVRFR